MIAPKIKYKRTSIHIFLATVDFSFDKRQDRDVFKLSTASLTENRYNVLQTSIWEHNQKYFDKNLVPGIYKNITGHNYQFLSEFRKATNLQMIKNHLVIKQAKKKWLGYQQSSILNNNKIKELMCDMIVYKSVNKETEYLATKQEFEKLGLNFEQTNEIKKFVNWIMEQNK